MKITELLFQPEGRRLEFKESIPTGTDLAKTIVAFANDAGGELYIGIKNKIIAPVFKKMGIIDQWGNGLKLIADELKGYPEIDFKWFEKGLQFQLQFIKKISTQPEFQQELQPEYDMEAIGKELGTKLGLSWDQAGTKLGPSWHQAGTKLAPS